MDKKYVTLLLVFYFTLQLAAYGQLQVESKVDSLIEKARTVINNNTDSLAIIADQAYHLALQSSYKKGMATAIRIKGVVAQFNNEYDSSIAHYTEALDLFEEIGDSLQVARTYYNIALIYNLRSDYERTIEYGLKAIKMSEQIGDINGEGRVYNLMGIAANARKDYEQSIAYFRQYSQKVASIPDSTEIATSYSNMGSTFQSMGQLDSAIHYLTLAEKIYLQMGTHRNMPDVYQNLGVLYEENNQLNEAEEYTTKGLTLAKSMGNRQREAGLYNNLGKIQNAQRHWQEAITNLSQSLQIADEIGDMEICYRSNEQLARSYAGLGQYEEAYRYHRDAAVYRDSLFSIEKTKAAQELQTQYETEKKEQQIEILNQQTAIHQLKLRQRGFLLIGAVVFLSVMALMIYFVQNRRKIRAEARLQRQAAKEVLEAEERERRRIATDLHDGVGQMLSAALLHVNEAHDTTPNDAKAKNAIEKALAHLHESYNEMRSISHQMMPNALLKAGLASSVREFVEKIDTPKMRISLDIVGLDQRLDEQTETVLYRIIQEAVNNVVKHAAASKLTLQLIKDHDGIALTIEDNGNGFDTAKSADFEGIGLRNIRSRVAMLDGTIDIDSAPNRGTLLAIHIPTYE